MIELKVKGNSSHSFYFKSLNECEKFMYVFKDHWCNVPWETPREVPDGLPITGNQRKSMSVSPKTRALNSLSWGFCLVSNLDIGLTEEQVEFVNNFIK